MPFNHQIVVKDDKRSLTVYVPGKKPVVIQGEDPNYDEAVKLAAEGDPQKDAGRLLGLAAPGIGISERFKELSDRVAVRGNKVYFDGDPLDNSLTEHIIRCLGDGEDIARPFVKFVEKINTNPSENSRNSLYNWLENRFTITDEGNIVMYKGAVLGKDGYRSTRQGEAIVDGKPVKGYVPYKVGSTITMPRSKVVDDPNSACHIGLHVATHDFATGFVRRENNPRVFKVEVDPRDVVSVPAHDNSKVRVCRMKVVDSAPVPVEKPIERKSKKEGTKKVQTKTKPTRDYLRKVAAKLNIPGRGRMSRDQLEAAVNKHEVASLNRDQLRKEAARLNIEGRGRMNKDQLQRAVAKARS